MRAIVLVALALCGCGGDPRPATGDATGSDGASQEDAYVPGMCDAPSTFADGLTPARTITVGSGGDYASIEAAAQAATPGTAIRLLPGTHMTDQFVANLRGTATAPIWIGGDPGTTKPLITGGAQALQLQRPAYVVIHDLEVANTTANGINIDDGGDFDDTTAAHHVFVTNVNIHDVGTAGGNNDCLKVSGINSLSVYDSVFSTCGGGGSGIDHVGCHDGVIARNVFDARMENAVQAKGGSTDIDIRQNRVRITGSRAFNLGGSTDLNLFRPSLSTSSTNAEARRIRAFNNIVGYLPANSAAFAFVGCIDCLVAHNATFGTPRWIIRILQETVTQGGFTFEPAAGGRVINNSFGFAPGSLATAVNEGANTNAASFTFSHNLWVATPTLPVTEDGMVIGPASLAPNGTPWDPYIHSPEIVCTGAPEWNAAAPLPQVDGTITGACRGTALVIGPILAESCTI